MQMQGQVAGKRSRVNVERLTGFLLAMSLTACVGAIAVGAGCEAYAEARLTLPSDADLIASPRPVLDWINALDARMTKVCTAR